MPIGQPEGYCLRKGGLEGRIQAVRFQGTKGISKDRLRRVRYIAFMFRVGLGGGFIPPPLQNTFPKTPKAILKNP